MRPSLVLVWTLGGSLFVLALVQAAFPEWSFWWWLPLPLVGLISGVDLILGLRASPILVNRSVASVVTQGRRSRAVLTLGPGLPRMRRLALFDGLPASFQTTEFPAKVRHPAPLSDGTLVFTYDFVATSRGTHSFGPAWIDSASPWGFWIRRQRGGAEQTVRVFPDTDRLLRDHLKLTGGSPGTGSHQVRRRGQGLEFHQLREYRQGDMIRLVDGKATSRLRRMVVREMQEEQDQTILFLIDTGYRMTDSEAGVRHFDRVFEAVLALAAVALRQGDRVGIRTWGPDERWIPPVRGRDAFPRLVEQLFDLHALPEASSPVAALQDLLPRLTRRSLVFLMTNFREEDAEDLAPLLPLYRARHLLCSVWLREGFVNQWKEREPQDFDEALGTVMAARYDDERSRGRRLSEARGLLTLDVTPAHLTGDLIGKYWEVKKRGLL